ncbi:MAG: Uma2 family endonuclease [Caldilineaceae bacterium]
MVIDDGVYTVAAFEHFCRLFETQDHLFELIQGRIVEKLPTEEHGLLVSNLGYALHNYAKRAKNGRIGCHVEHRMPQDDYNLRMPDLALNNVGRPLIREGCVLHMPSLAVDIQLPDVSVEQLRAKAAYYLENGGRLVWLVYPEKRLIEVYRPDADVELLVEGDALTGGDVLPSFTLAVAGIFADA